MVFAPSGSKFAPAASWAARASSPSWRFRLRRAPAESSSMPAMARWTQRTSTARLSASSSRARDGLRGAGFFIPAVSSSRSVRRVKHAKLRVKGSVAVFGQRGGFGEKLGEALAAGGALKDAKGLLASLLRGGHVHFQGEPRTAFGELFREHSLCGLAIRCLPEGLFDLSPVSR